MGQVFGRIFVGCGVEQDCEAQVNEFRRTHSPQLTGEVIPAPEIMSGHHEDVIF